MRRCGWTPQLPMLYLPYPGYQTLSESFLPAVSELRCLTSWILSPEHSFDVGWQRAILNIETYPAGHGRVEEKGKKEFSKESLVQKQDQQKTNQDELETQWISVPVLVKTWIWIVAWKLSRILVWVGDSQGSSSRSGWLISKCLWAVGGHCVLVDILGGPLFCCFNPDTWHY